MPMIDELHEYEDEKPHDYWLSYSDMMAGLIMMFMLLLMLLVYVFSDSVKASVAQQQEAKEKFEEQSLKIADQSEKLKEAEVKLQSIIGIKTEIIRELTDMFKEKGINVIPDQQTGAISFDSSVLFGYGSAKVTKEGKEILKSIFPTYVSVLLDDQYREYISQIIIEGHTDDDGGYLYNLDLSQRRALAVAVYIMGNEFPDFSGKEHLESYMTSNGRSYSELKLLGDGTVDKDASRRVEVKFRLNEEDMMQEIKNILDEEALRR